MSTKFDGMGSFCFTEGMKIPGKTNVTFYALAFPTPIISSRRVDLLTATEAQLKNLFEACDTVECSNASFRTLELAHFSSNFNLERSGLLQALQPALIDGYLEKLGIEAELRELNVYGEPLDPFSNIPISTGVCSQAKARIQNVSRMSALMNACSRRS
jgi:hypothetical protein